ncbi:hypothetical protein GCK72_000701 [Caenorhabditis remanei]|uniref:F-box domain-containing protein n=1 Tax=Caenorhabditis remanei TaxID=31234 RepID=A0A6A5HLV6_CAERE|nr:hypothetical protein GCK72_000701 [Caenorhabditis remanei]KAF1768888.1 hypothetical protein GCK72_000701 [Caenorhabditis remanei]
MIESTMKSRLDKIISITYFSSNPDNVRISSSNSNSKEFMKLLPREEGRNRPIVRMNLFGIDVDCCMATRNHPFFILCNQQNGERMLQKIHNYFSQFFGSSIEYHLRNDSSNYTNYIPRLRNIKNSDLCFWSNATAAQLLNGYLAVSPSQEYIRLDAHGGFEYESNLKLAQTNVLDISIPDSRAGVILNNFKGRHLFMSEGTLTDDDVIQFLNNWKSSQANQNLEYLCIRSFVKINLNPQNVMRNIDIKQFYPYQIPVYRYDRRSGSEDECDWTIEEFKSRNFIVRDADQHVASLNITTQGIQFASWKMTEEEVMRGKIQKIFQRTPTQKTKPIRNTIKISKMPWLVQRLIFSNMDLVELLMMAFCSKKFFRIIKSLSRNRLDKIFTITYESMHKSCINISSSSSGDDPFMSLRWRHELRGRPLIPMKLVGMDLQVSMPSINHPLMILYDSERQETLLTSIHNYFLDLFGSSVEYQLNVNTLMPPFSKLKNISSTHLSSHIRVTEFHNFLTISPNQDFMALSEFHSVLLGRNLEFARTKVLHIGSANRSIDDILSNFEGRQLFINDGIISDTAIIQFMNKWRSNEGYQNLEYISITVCRYGHPIKPNQIRNSFPINRLDLPDQLPVYQFAKKDPHQKHTWGIHKFTSRNYIVRDSDQHVASIMVTENNFTFAAWNMTEKEFLEKRPFKRFY